MTEEELQAFVAGAADGSWADYQLAALLMAITLRGMAAEETAALTRAVVASGKTVDFSGLRRPKVDKHSTGGVGDKVSLILAPLVAACGAAVPMMSGRGLGHTGGTLDKLEAIPGFRTDLSIEAFRSVVDRVGTAIIGQSAELAPADLRLYALRDVTATVESVPLICASILGKKFAEGIDGLVLDVKFGRGAFMPDLARARELAEAMIGVGRAMGKPVRALLTAMDQPLGRTVGNAVEVAEAIACLKCRGPEDVMEVTLALGVEMLLVARMEEDPEAARERLVKALASGAALATFREMVAAQGGDERCVDEPERLPQAPATAPVIADGEGIVAEMDALKVAWIAVELGAGRVKRDDRIEPAVGVADLVKVGERVSRGSRLATVAAMSESAARDAASRLAGAFRLAPEAPVPRPLIADTLRK